MCIRDRNTAAFDDSSDSTKPPKSMAETPRHLANGGGRGEGGRVSVCARVRRGWRLRADSSDDRGAPRGLSNAAGRQLSPTLTKLKSGAQKQQAGTCVDNLSDWSQRFQNSPSTTSEIS
eukprot:7247526-Prymnesium_polylepis.1